MQKIGKLSPYVGGYVSTYIAAACELEKMADVIPARYAALLDLDGDSSE